MGGIHFATQLLIEIFVTIFFFWRLAQVNEVGEKVKISLMQVTEVTFLHANSFQTST